MPKILATGNTEDSKFKYFDQTQILPWPGFITAVADVDSTLVYTLVGRLDRETPDLEVLVALATRGWGTFS